MLKVLINALHKLKIKINTMKTETMFMSKMHSDLNLNIQINNSQLQEGYDFCYLGSIVTSNNKSKNQTSEEE